ncbi:hypothetical protein BD770DRAFT_474144 [Pilaira anomala]|nr:hypothetical protein BD770DRAFT_474144 [Pilaira anomala]
MDNIKLNVLLLSRKIAELTMDFQKLNGQKDSTSKCIQAGQNLHFLFRQQMEYVASQCRGNCDILANIKCELEIANKNKRFDLVTIFEVVENTKKLLSNLEETQQKNERMKEEMCDIVKLVAEEKLAIDNKPFNSFILFANHATLRGILSEFAPITVIAAVQLGIHRGIYSSIKIAFSAIGCSLLAGSIIRAIAYCQEENFKSKSEPINNLLQKVYHLQQCSIDFNNLVARIIEDLLNLVKSAEKNLAYRFIDGDRVSLLTEKMINETKSLQTCFLLVESKATKFSKKYMILKSKAKKLE